jgi:hypothetical protein
MTYDPIARHELAERGHREMVQIITMRADELESIEEFALARWLRERAAVYAGAERRANRDARLQNIAGGNE